MYEIVLVRDPSEEYLVIKAMLCDRKEHLCGEFYMFGFVAQKRIGKMEGFYNCDNIAYMSHGGYYIPYMDLARISKNFSKLQNKFHKNLYKNLWSNSLTNSLMSLLNAVKAGSSITINGRTGTNTINVYELNKLFEFENESKLIELFN